MLVLIPFNLSAYIVSLTNPVDNTSPIVSVGNSEGLEWDQKETYLSYLSFDELGYLSYRTYPFSEINSPGFYRLAGNVSNQITIAVSDVTLDMNGCTVSGGANGIVINGGLNNVTIKNGAINGVSSDGIQVNFGCQDITLRDIAIRSSVRGVFFDCVVNALVRNCDMYSNTTGIELSECHNILLEDCISQANLQAGYSLISSTTCSFFGCKALSNGYGNTNSSGDESNVYGFVSRDGYGNIFERCLASATQNLNATDWNTIVAGFALLGTGTQCHKIIECEADNAITSTDGLSVPYGIYLDRKFNGLDLVTTASLGFRDGYGVDWSPDGRYLAVIDNNSAFNQGELSLYEFDREQESLILLQAISLAAAGFDCAWSPSGKYVAVAINGSSSLYKFDSINNELNVVSSDLGVALMISWSSDEQYVATRAGSTYCSIYRMDRITDTFSFVVNSSTTAGTVFAVDWSPVADYIASIDGLGNVQVFAFDRSSGTIAQVGSTVSLGITSLSLKWSFDGRYITLAGDGATKYVLLFENDTLSLLTSASIGGGEDAMNWSPDGKYIVGTGTIGGNISAVSFDGANLHNEGSIVIACIDNSWSPDGEYIAVGTRAYTINIYRGLQFPTGNMIQNNKVYCNAGNQIPRGSGISGSSISNMIIGNTAFDNSFNYQFVTNVFNQLFGLAPTDLQNIESVSKNPIINTIDFPARLRRIEVLSESLIDNLL